MRKIDLQTWPRREHFKLFSAMEYPYFSLSTNYENVQDYLRDPAHILDSTDVTNR